MLKIITSTHKVTDACYISNTSALKIKKVLIDLLGVNKKDFQIEVNFYEINYGGYTIEINLTCENHPNYVTPILKYVGEQAIAKNRKNFQINYKII